jgi:hypothetical protein
MTDEATIRRMQRELESKAQAVRSGLIWFGIVVLCLATALAIHYLDV